MTRTSWDHLLGRHPTMFEKTRFFLRKHPRSTAVVIARSIKVKLSSLSGLLYRGVNEGAFVRHDGQGPRGGHVYENAVAEDNSDILDE